VSEPIPVQIDPEAINRYVAEKILDSALGQHIEDAIQNALKKDLYGRGSVVQQAVDQAIQEHVRVAFRELIRGEFAPLIREALTERLTPEALGKIADRFVEQLGLITTEDMGLR
jgi:hypothetical protein